MTATVSAPKASLEAAVQATHKRLRWEVILRELGRDLPWALALLVVFSLLQRVGWVAAPTLWGGLGACVLGLLLLVSRALRNAPSPLAAALRLDRAHQLQGRLATTWEINQQRAHNRAGTSNIPRSREDEAFFQLVQNDLHDRGPFSPRQAAPLSFPHGLTLSLGLCAVGAVVLLVPMPKPESVPVSSERATATEPEKWLSEDDAELLKRTVVDLEQEVQSQEGKDAADRFNEIVLSVVSGDLTRKEAFQLAAELEADLEGTADEANELHEGLAQRGEALSKREATRQVGRALGEKRYKDAAEALRKLAERLKSGDEGLSKEEMEDLRQSLEQLRKDQEKTSTEQEEASSAQREALAKRAQELKKKEQSGQASAAEKEELKRAERELKRLNRQKKEASQAKKTLSELDKQLAEAAKALAEERKKSGEFMDQASKTVSQAAKRTLSDEEKKEILKQLKELKERLRRQRKEGDQKERLRNFQKRARGQGQGQPGGQGQGKESKGPGQLRVQLGPGGVPLPGTGQTGEPGEGEGPQEGAGAGRDPGQGHDPSVGGEESRLEGAKTQDALAVAQDSGEGQSASETIVTAAEEGFTRGAYHKLFVDYETVAEEVMERENIPPGRKAHVQRYFELIRPRGDAPLPQKEK